MEQLGFDFQQRDDDEKPLVADETVEVRSDPATPVEVTERAVRLTELLSQHLPEAIRVVVTDNKRMMISAKPRDGRLEIRLHHMFLFADDEIVRDLARYLKHRDRRSGQRLDAFIAENRHRIDKRRRRRTVLRPRGRVYDLRPILQELQPRFVEDMSAVTITWGRLPNARQRQRSVQLGSYSAEDRVIRIHPVLDQPWVPRWYVATVVFHEMLHHALPAERVGRTMRHHTRAFRARERAYEHHEAARQWEEANLTRLLRSIKTLTR